MGASFPVSTSRLGRILRRTLSGAGLASGVALVLWWNHARDDGAPLLLVSGAVLLACVFEVGRMGSIALLDCLPALLIAALGVLIVEHAGREAAQVPALPVLYAWALGLAGTAHALSRALRRLPLLVDPLPRLLTYLVVVAIAWFPSAAPDELALRMRAGGIALAVLLATSLVALRSETGRGRAVVIAAGLAAWIVPGLACLPRVHAEWGTPGLVAFLACAKIGDTAGYYAGNAFGRHHPFPRLSPGKTIEGCLASLLAATLAGGLAVQQGLLPGAHAGFASGLAAGGIVNLAAQSGDLVESWVKRRAGVKDSSRLFGPSGGLLDQVDSLLLALPAALLAWPWLLAR